MMNELWNRTNIATNGTQFANHVYLKRTESYRLLKVLLQVSICYTELLRHSRSLNHLYNSRHEELKAKAKERMAK
jgi:hypothetical protein